MNLFYKSLLLATLTMFLFAASLYAATDTALAQTAIQNPPAAAHAPTQTPAEHAEAIEQRWYLSGLIVVLLGVGVVYRLKFRKRPA